jgi:hypothetical protein
MFNQYFSACFAIIIFFGGFFGDRERGEKYFPIFVDINYVKLPYNYVWNYVFVTKLCDMLICSDFVVEC